MTLTPDEREAAIEKMARAIASSDEQKGALPFEVVVSNKHSKASLYETAEAALAAVLPLIERAVLLRAADYAADPNRSWHNTAHGRSVAIRISADLAALADEVRT